MNYWIRIIFLMIFDIFLINLAIYISLLLRFDGKIDPEFFHSFLRLIPWYSLISLVSLYFYKIYQRIWQYASLGEIFGIIKAITTSSIIAVLGIYTLHLPYLPRSVYILSWILMVVLIGSSRLGWRVLRNFVIQDISSIAKRTLIVGAGDGGAMVARELINNKSINLIPVGFIDDSQMKKNMTLYGIPVLGNRYNIPQVVEHYEIEEIIIAIPSANGRIIREIIEICRETSARLRIFQGGGDLLSDKQKFRDIELKDLLRREPVVTNLDEIASYIKDKVILVSGAGGSIGSELCRQICSFNPRKVLLVEYSENNLFDIDNELRVLFPLLEIVPELSDIKDRLKIKQVFKRHQPHVVFHAAAYKHVPLMEKNPSEAIKNNVIGTKNMAEMSDRFEAEVFILISTDKAVNPTSIMGATKRIAEMIIQDYNNNSATRFAAVRFGNVLGSRGSVVPTFERQIKEGGPITVTHPDMTRYFMTIPEAVQLVIQAGAMAQGGEVFVLDMGNPVKIVDLARDLIRLHGYAPDKDIKIAFTGIRPGEKLYEELFSANEQIAATRHDRIFISDGENNCSTSLSDTIDNLFTRVTNISADDAIGLICKVLPDFKLNTSVYDFEITSQESTSNQC